MNGKKLFAALLALTLSVALLTGCGGGATTDAPSKAKSGASSNATTVSDVESLLEAIGPGAEIVLASGYYNMSDYVNGLWATEGDAWNAAHEYVQLGDCYDGAEIFIQNVDGLSVSGGGATADTELVIDPQYGTVLTFRNCKNVKLSNLTLGHTEMGYCAGNVVDLSACENVELRNMDLYGCGVTGLECCDGTGDVFVYDSVLRDCSDGGPLAIYGGAGKFEFHNCVLTGSESGGYYDGGARADVGFYSCTFGANETNYWAFADGITIDGCTWDEVTMYPDYDYDYDAEYGYAPESMPENLQPLTFDEETYADTGWTGYLLKNAETGDELSPPSGGSAADVTMALRSDGTGSINGYYADREISFLWEHTGAATLTLTTLHDGNLEANFYQVPDDSEEALWFSVRIGDALLWMY